MRLIRHGRTHGPQAKSATGATLSDLPFHILGLIADQIQEREEDGHIFLEVRRDQEGVSLAFVPALDIDPDAGRWTRPSLPH
jgi:hypothetical protein